MTEIGAAPEGPIVDRMPTRAIEQRGIIRTHVHSLASIAVDGHSLSATTNDRTTTRFTDGDRADISGLDGVSQGSLRLDVVADDVLRIRYAPAGIDLRDAASPMVVGTLRMPSDVSIDDTTITTSALRATITHKPFMLTISTAGGREVCRIGGREKNQWNLWDTLNTGVSRTADGDRPIATECYALRPGEAVYGFGEKFIGGINKVGQTIDLNMVEVTGTTTQRSYKNIPFCFTTHGYGIFWHTTGRATCWVGSQGAADVQVAIEDDRLDQYVFVGDPKHILDQYTTLTGKAQMPPRWSFGWWQSKISYRAAAEVEDVVDRHLAAGLPIDVIHLDTHWFREDWRCDLEFDPERLPDPQRFMGRLADRGVHTSLW